ncbi:MAG: CCA tRNA nucleotidyltransferase [Candidatus Gallimonas sp.]
MKIPLPQSLISLAGSCERPLYLVGGFVRDFLRGRIAERPDYDLSSPMTEEELLKSARDAGFTVTAVYRNTGTVKLVDGEGNGYEFTRFRSDKYVRGLHAPTEITFTEDAETDARRRDFCANAVYYDVKREEFLDPLDGIADIRNKTLRTVRSADRVFGEDGLRLLRLARIAAETDFSPDEECLGGAKEHAALLSDIFPERIFSELNLLLHADKKGGSPYRGLCLLRETETLKYFLPELWAGNGLAQRKDFHDHDVLEHTFRCVKYSPPNIRFAALLHDAGKPFCYMRDGNFHDHAREGAAIAGQILSRLKAPKKLTQDTQTLVLLHMKDFDLKMKESKIRRTAVEYDPLMEDLLALFQADYSACKDDLSPAPVAVKWRSVLDRMKKEGAPRNLKELAVKGGDLIDAGVPPVQTGRALNDLLSFAAENGARNARETLLRRAVKFYAKEEKP